MRIELARFLTERIAEYGSKINAAPISMPLRIIAAPPHAGVPWCSPVFLEIAANPLIRESWTKGDGSLGELAEDFVKFAQQDSWASNRVIFSASSRGHINIQPLASVKHEFIAALAKHGARQIYSSKPILYNSDIRQLHTQKIEPVSFAQYTQQIFQATANSRANDIQKLLQHMYSKGAILVDDLLMLIFLHSDAELDPEPYIRGIKGKQHKPWYMLRALSDLERASSMRIDLNSKPNNLLEVLIDSRRYFFKDQAFESLVGIAECLNNLADEFYRFYNDPKVRLVSVASNSQSDTLPIVEIINQIIAEGYWLMKTSCELTQEVLKKEGLLKN